MPVEMKWLMKDEMTGSSRQRHAYEMWAETVLKKQDFLRKHIAGIISDVENQSRRASVIGSMHEFGQNRGNRQY